MRFRRSIAVAVLLAFSAIGPALLAAADTKPASKKKPKTPPAEAKKAPPQTGPATNVTVQTQGEVTVVENYYLDLPGIDLSTLTPKQKQKYLDRVNKEFCSCGCPNDTIARCLVNDPKCPTVRGLAEKVLSEIKAGG
ncbi:MAG TPA: hypothetical protein VGR67_10485 [Candidatus Polarisedimenticolia bacterium]|nr:hypothetical protein [Candidatus Polarisedimenticolia bacterium]